MPTDHHLREDAEDLLQDAGLQVVHRVVEAVDVRSAQGGATTSMPISRKEGDRQLAM